MTGDLKDRIIQLVSENNFQGAQKLCETLCELLPSDPETLFLTGAVYGQLGNFTASEKVLRDALALAPDHPMLNYNLGIALFHQQCYEQAKYFFSRSVELAPNQYEALMLLGQSSEACGTREEAIKAYTQAIALQPKSEEALHALGNILLASEKWPEASNVYAHLLELNPSDTRCIDNLYIALSRLTQYERLITLLKPVALESPGAIEPNYNVALSHHSMGEIEDALTFYNRVLTVDPGHIGSKVGLAAIHHMMGQHEEALRTIRPLVEKHPNEPDVALLFASMAPRFKLSRKAAALLEWHLENSNLSNIMRGKISVELGNLYDKLGDHEQAFHYIKSGNESNPANFDREDFIKNIEILEELYTEDSIVSMPTSGLNTLQPIFIVSMPRSGSTLVEQILASHSQVFGAGELKYIQNIYYEIQDLQPNGKVSPSCLAIISSEKLLRHANDYQGHLNRLSGGASRVTDKVPSNHLYLGLIYQLFPKAKVIHIKRDPMDTCFSCYCKFFSGGYPFIYNLDDLGFYYRSYERLMGLWNKVLPLAILNVSYEELILDQNNITRKILEFCELPWEPACLEFYKTERTVATASTEQVRRPIYTDAVGKWRRYEHHLDALVKALGKYS